MENRYSPRVPVNVPIVIYFLEQPIAWGITRDISHTGMFVRAVTPRAIVESVVEIYWPDAHRSARLPLELTHRGIPARVVRYATDGLGLYIEDNREQRSVVIQALMDSAGKPFHLQGS